MSAGSALLGNAAIAELTLLSGVKRKSDFEPAKGRFWREAVISTKSPGSSDTEVLRQRHENEAVADNRRQPGAADLFAWPVPARSGL